jgi:hypothetical protein
MRCNRSCGAMFRCLRVKRFRVQGRVAKAGHCFPTQFELCGKHKQRDHRDSVPWIRMKLATRSRNQEKGRRKGRSMRYSLCKITLSYTCTQWHLRSIFSFCPLLPDHHLSIVDCQPTRRAATCWHVSQAASTYVDTSENRSEI